MSERRNLKRPPRLSQSFLLGEETVRVLLDRYINPKSIHLELQVSNCIPTLIHQKVAFPLMMHIVTHALTGFDWAPPCSSQK